MEESLEDLFIRISHPWAKCELLIDKWASICDKVAVYEHEADGEKHCNRTHIHLILKSPGVGRKRIRQLAEEMAFPIKGNENCCMKNWDGKEVPTCVYMAKGIYDPKYLKGYTLEDADYWKSLWVEHAKKQNMTISDQLTEEFMVEFNDPMQITDVDELKKAAHLKAFKACNCIANQRYFALYKQLVMTYVLRKGMSYHTEKLFSSLHHMITDPMIARNLPFTKKEIPQREKLALPPTFELSNGEILDL